MNTVKAKMVLPMQFSDTEEGLEYVAIGLVPGIWTGIDGHTIRYPETLMPQFTWRKGTRVKSAHAKTADSVVAYHKENLVSQGQVVVRGVVFDQDEIKWLKEQVAANKKIGISIEKVLDTEVEGDHLKAVKVHSGGSYIITDTPAVPDAEIISLTPVTLESGSESDSDNGKNRTEGKTNMTTEVDLTKYPGPKDLTKLSDSEKEIELGMYAVFMTGREDISVGNAAWLERFAPKPSSNDSAIKALERKIDSLMGTVNSQNEKIATFETALHSVGNDQKQVLLNEKVKELKKLDAAFEISDELKNAPIETQIAAVDVMLQSAKRLSNVEESVEIDLSSPEGISNAYDAVCKAKWGKSYEETIAFLCREPEA